MMLHAINY